MTKRPKRMPSLGKAKEKSTVRLEKKAKPVVKSAAKNIPGAIKPVVVQVDKQPSLQKNVLLPIPVKIERITRFTQDTWLFRLAVKMKHEPGQFVQLSIMGYGEAPISICSYSENYIELCVRRLGNVTNALFRMQEGDWVGIRGPYGKGYPMDKLSSNVIVVGGGTGAAPVRGAIEYIARHHKQYPNVFLFFGFRTVEDMLFPDDMKKWTNQFGLNLTVDKKTSGYNGKVGLVTELLNNAKLQLDSSAILCGPPIMIKFVVQSLLEKGLSKQQIWVSLERHMKCGIGKCGHCQVGAKYVCKDGPVFNYTEVEGVRGE